MANMMLVVAMSVEKACEISDASKLCDLKCVSTYGLSLDLVLPLRILQIYRSGGLLFIVCAFPVYRLRCCQA